MASLHEYFKNKPKAPKDAALADLGKVISEDFKFKLLNREELEIDSNFVNNLTNCEMKYLSYSAETPHG
ncbi:MAG: hypothetical protein EBQ95_03075 [Gammaproteobacteria bacterium]|nr:hypothetical protein [Gammaproteobacteria bacterium]